MDAVSITIGASWIFVGLLSAGLSIPLMNDKVVRNPFYGMRFAQSFESDKAWFAINRYGGRKMFLWSWPLVAIGIVSLLVPLVSRPIVAILLGLGPLMFIFVPAIQTWRFARRYE